MSGSRLGVFSAPARTDEGRLKRILPGEGIEGAVHGGHVLAGRENVVSPRAPLGFMLQYFCPRATGSVRTVGNGKDGILRLTLTVPATFPIN
jgi:hypothetical protein